MRNYGPSDLCWQLWHEGPVLDRENVVLVHGFRFPLAAKRGRCNKQFMDLDRLLQASEHRYNVWQFEYTADHRGTFDRVSAYASRLAKAIDRVRDITENATCSIVGYSLGGILARQYIAMGGKSRVDRLLTLATPNMGTLRFEPFSLQRRWAKRMFPRVAVELRPDSRLLWDLNIDVHASSVPEFAAIGGYSWGRTDGMIELGSTSLVKCGPDGSIAEHLYFTGVRRSHLNINRIVSTKNEVFQLVHAFLSGGVEGIRSLRPAEKPEKYDATAFLTFSLREKPDSRMNYPCVIVENTGHRYSGLRMLSQGARTECGSHIFAVQLKPDDDGDARVCYAPGKYTVVRIRRGQSTVVTKPIDTNGTVRKAISDTASRCQSVAG